MYFVWHRSSGVKVKHSSKMVYVTKHAVGGWKYIRSAVGFVHFKSTPRKEHTELLHYKSGSLSELKMRHSSFCSTFIWKRVKTKDTSAGSCDVFFPNKGLHWCRMGKYVKRCTGYYSSMLLVFCLFLIIHVLWPVEDHDTSIVAAIL